MSSLSAKKARLTRLNKKEAEIYKEVERYKATHVRYRVSKLYQDWWKIKKKIEELEEAILGAEEG